MVTLLYSVLPHCQVPAQQGRTVECPQGMGKPAVETLLLHHEQLKVPENLVRNWQGSWGGRGGEMGRFGALSSARWGRASLR